MNLANWPAGQSPLRLVRHTDSSNPWSGLSAVLLQISPMADLGPLTIEARFDGSESNSTAVFMKTFEGLSSSATVHFGVHTHLLPNGPCHLTFIAQQASLSWTLHIPFTVNNPSALAAGVRESLRRSGTPVIFAGPCDTGYYDFKDAALTPWFDRPNAKGLIPGLASQENLTAREVSWLEDFVEKGFIVMDDLVDRNLLEQVRGELDDAMTRGVHGAEWGSSRRIEHLHGVYAGIRRLWKHDPIQRMLGIIFQSTPRPCQTLTYFFGSEQDAHQDTVHLTPFPAGYMCGVWIAIDDVQPNSGELEVFPGSHRLPRVYMKDVNCPKVESDWARFGALIPPLWQKMLKERGFEPMVYRPKAGTVLIWHENLMHRGSKRQDQSLSRRSIVSHVFADGCICFYDSTGMVGNMDPVSPDLSATVRAGGSDPQ